MANKKYKFRVGNGDLVVAYVKRPSGPKKELSVSEKLEKQWRRDVLCGIAAVIAIILIFVWFFSWLGAPHQVKDGAKIAELRAADPEYYSEIKAELAEYVEDEQGVTPKKVVFKVGIQNYVYHLFDVTIWYQTENGVWYSWNQSWFDLPVDLEAILIREFVDPSWE